MGKVSGQVRRPVEEQYVDVAPAVLRSKLAFLRDLPGLLENPKFDRWSVAYCEDERIAIAPSEVAVLRACKERGLQSHQYYLGVVVPHDEDVHVERSPREIE